MKFKVVKGTDTFSKLEAINKKNKECNKEALTLVESWGLEKFGIDSYGVAGGISCVKADEKPKGFKQVGKKNQGLYYPKANNKELINQIKALTVVSTNEFNECIGFESQFRGLSHYRYFGMITRSDYFLIDIDNECDYTPREDMLEILESEYKSLSK